MSQIIASKIKNPWPKEKRKAARQVIEWDLKTYKVVKADIEETEKEIDEMASPSATDIRENIYTKSKEITFGGGFNTSVVIGTPTRDVGDPTVSKAEAISRYQKSMFASGEYKEVIRRIKAIERVMDRLKRSSIPNENLKVRLIEMKYFEQDKSDKMIADELHIGHGTYWRWRDSVLEEIAKNLGFII
jgi:hypothetical protein